MNKTINSIKTTKLKKNNLTGGKKIPVKFFLRNSSSLGYKISPDGKYVLYLGIYKKYFNVFIKNLSNKKINRISKKLVHDIENCYWGNNNILVFLMDNKGDENFHLFKVNKDGTNLKDMTNFNNIQVEIIDLLEESESEILIKMNKRNPEIFDVYRLNIETGDLNLVAENPGNVSEWITDHNGNIRIGVVVDGLKNKLLYRENQSQPFKTILNFSFKDSFIPLFFTFDNINLYASSNIGRDKNALVLFDLQEGKEIEVIYEHPQVDVKNLYFSRKRKRLTYISYLLEKQEIKVLDKSIKILFDKLNCAKYNISIINSDINENLFIVFRGNSIDSGSYYLYNKIKNKLIKLGSSFPWLNKVKLSEKKPITFQSRNGFTIHGFLSAPKKTKIRNLPVITLVHGGPWWRDYIEFGNELQFFTNCGYAVFQINYRGSTGYGRKFWEAGFKQWGNSMQNDISDGVKWLIEKGIADPSRIGICGWSYGGYAALAGLAFTPELYKCGIDFYGISNIFTFYKSIPAYWTQYLESLYEMIGHPVSDKDLLMEISPFFHVDNIKAPLFIAQGKNDARVNINESNQMVNRLKENGNIVKYFVVDGGHGSWSEVDLIYTFLELEKFLKRYL